MIIVWLGRCSQSCSFLDGPGNSQRIVNKIRNGKGKRLSEIVKLTVEAGIDMLTNQIAVPGAIAKDWKFFIIFNFYRRKAEA